MKFYFHILLSLPSLIIGCASSQGQTANKCSPVSERFEADSFWVDVSHYGKPSLKNILIMPPTGGANFIDRSYAEKFCKAGFEVFILKDWAGQNEENIELTLHQRLYERSQKAISLVLDQITPAASIGLFGTSVGGLFAAVAASYQDRLNAVFIIAAGAPIASVIVTSDQKVMKNLAEARKEKYGFRSDAEYLTALSNAFHLEPMKLGAGYKKKKLGAVIALKDTTVATALQKELAEYWKPQLVIEENNGHRFTILNTWIFRSDEILNFFN